MRIIIILTLIIYVSTAPLTVNEKILNVTIVENKCPYLRTTIHTPNKQLLSMCDDFQKTQDIKEVNLFNLPEALCGLYYNIFQSTCMVANDERLKEMLLGNDIPKADQYNITSVCKSIGITLTNGLIESDFANNKKCENICKIPMTTTIYPICQASAFMANIYLNVEEKQKSTSPSSVEVKIVIPIERHQKSENPEIQISGNELEQEPKPILSHQEPKQSDALPNQPSQTGKENKLPIKPPQHQNPEPEPKKTINSNQPQLQDPVPSQTPLPNKDTSSPILQTQNFQPSQNIQSDQHETSQQTPNKNSLEDNDVFVESKDTVVNKVNPSEEKPLIVSEVHPSNDLENKPAEVLTVDETEDKEDANSAEKQMGPPNVNDFDTHEDDYGDAEPEVVEKVKPAPVKPLKTDQDLSAAFSNQNMNDDDSYFFFYFMVVCVASVLGYVGYHNKQKILAIVLEGRKGRRSQRRRPNSANYHKLDCNLEEAVTSSCNKNTTNVIY